MSDVNAALLADVHEFWFGKLADPDDYPKDKAEGWFKRSDEFDALIKERYGAQLDAVAEHDWDLAGLSREEQVGLIIYLDQFPRNLFREDGRAFAYDARAREIMNGLIELGLDRFYLVEKSFVLLPLQHSEDIADQDRAAFLYASETLDAEGDDLERARLHLDFSFAHRKLIRQFGRFPHRNAMLGREPTEEETKFLEDDGRGY